METGKGIPRRSRFARGVVAGILALGLVPAAAFAAPGGGGASGSSEPAESSAITELAAQEQHKWDAFLESGNAAALANTGAYDFEDGSSIDLQWSLPSSLDLRDNGVVTPVKSQNPWGTCWGFAAIAASETSILSELGMTYEETGLDLSELQLAWFSQTALPEDAGSQAGEGSYVLSDIPAMRLNTGGMPFTATSIFSQGVGPISEELAPYRNAEGEIIYDDNNEPYCYSPNGDWSVSEDLRFAQFLELEGSNMLPSPAGVTSDGGYEYNEAGTVAIKNELMEGRAVQIAFMADQSLPGQVSEQAYMNPDTWAHYTYEPVGANHAVTIVGWDDDYSKGNFTEGHQPPNDGAWIVKNSWGSDSEEFPNGIPGGWGVDGEGYFYLSYYDQSLMVPETLDYDTSHLESDHDSYYANAYDYMPSSSTSSVAQAAETRMANVFVAEGSQIVRTVGTETAAPGTTVTYEVYLLDDDATGPEDGRLAASASDTYTYGGFHRSDLNLPVIVNEGERFSVVVTQRSASGVYQLLAESALNKEGVDVIAEMFGWQLNTYSKGVVNRGESYFYSDGTWTDWADGIEQLRASSGMGNLVDYDNFAIKAYSDPVDQASAKFSDVEEGAWYEDAVSYVAGYGIMSGYEGTDLFGTFDSLERQDLACVLYNYLAPESDKVAPEAMANTTPFADVEDGAYYTAAVNWCYEHGVMTGYGDGSAFGVGDDVTREQFAVTIHRLGGEEPVGSIDTWPDKGDVSSWAEAALAYCVHYGIVNGSDGYLLPQKDATRAETAAMLVNFIRAI